MNEFMAYWKNYVNFNDRTTRRGYWMATLFLIIASIVLSIIDSIIGMNILSSLLSLACFIPTLAITFRRLRDAGKHPAWILINLVPIIGSCWFLILLCKASVPADNTPVV